MAWVEMPSFCGAQILYSLRFVNRDKFDTAEACLSRNYFNYPGTKIPFIVFGDVDRGDSVCGLHYAKVIKDNKLGEIWISEKKRNINSGNLVNLFVWTVDWDAYGKFAHEHRRLWDTVKDKMKKIPGNIINRTIPVEGSTL